MGSPETCYWSRTRSTGVSFVCLFGPHWLAYDFAICSKCRRTIAYSPRYGTKKQIGHCHGIASCQGLKELDKSKFELDPIELVCFSNFLRQGICKWDPATALIKTLSYIYFWFENGFLIILLLCRYNIICRLVINLHFIFVRQFGAEWLCILDIVLLLNYFTW